MKSIPKEWVEKWNPCAGGLAEWDGNFDAEHALNICLEKLSVYDVVWWVFHTLDNDIDRARLIVFCAEICLPIINDTYKDDETAMVIINAMKSWIDDPTDKNFGIVSGCTSSSNALVSKFPARSKGRTAARTIFLSIKSILKPSMKISLHTIESAAKVYESALTDIIDYWKTLI